MLFHICAALKKHSDLSRSSRTLQSPEYHFCQYLWLSKTSFIRSLRNVRLLSFSSCILSFSSCTNAQFYITGLTFRTRNTKQKLLIIIIILSRFFSLLIMYPFPGTALFSRFTYVSIIPVTYHSTSVLLLGLASGKN